VDFGVTVFLRLFNLSIQNLATFGAISAIILLIFRDTILGFIASIQVSVVIWFPQLAVGLRWTNLEQMAM
jgi:hypothetical protein